MLSIDVNMDNFLDTDYFMIYEKCPCCGEEVYREFSKKDTELEELPVAKYRINLSPDVYEL